MINLTCNSVTVQAVRRGTDGATLDVPFVVIQTINSVHVERVLVVGATVQLIRAGDEGANMHISQALIQVVHGGTPDGAVEEVSAESVQVIYTVGIPENARQRAWTYDLDGHTFYVLDLGDRGALLYDLTTQQWTHYETVGYDGHWNMKNGFHWRTGKQVLGGDTVNGTVWKLNPGSYFDDGWRPCVYEVRGAIFATDVAFHRQFALRLMGSVGRLADDVAPVLNMRYSDDNGATWSREYSVTLTMDTKQRIEWRSLGAFTQPGRIFRLYDTGGLKFISMCMADVEGV